MQRTEGMTVAHHRSDWLYHVKRVDWQEEWGETDKTMAEEFKKTPVKAPVFKNILKSLLTSAI